MQAPKEFFDFLFPDLEDGEYIELRHQPQPNGKAMRAIFCDSVEAVLAQLEKINQGHVYFGVAPRKGKVGTKAGVTETGVMWVDVDDTKHLLPALFEPSLVVDSGYGLHVYWKLDHRIPAEEAEAQMKLLSKKLKGDHAWDITRILRVPGSMNRKRRTPVPCTVTYSPWHVYTTTEIQAMNKISHNTLVDIFSEEATDQKSRSERDFHIIAELKKIGLGLESVQKVFDTRPCGNKWRERQGDYLQRTFTKVEVKPSDGADTGIVEEDGAYWMQGQSKRRLSNFLLQPTFELQRTDGHGDSLACNLIARNRTTQVVLDAGALASKEKFGRTIKRIDCVWQGSDRELSMLHQHLINQVHVASEATAILGNYKQYWIGTDCILSATEKWDLQAAPIKYIDPGQRFIETSYAECPDVAELARTAIPQLLNINRPTVIAPILGWLAACPFKERLWLNQNRFPILNVFGTRGSGKTATINYAGLPLLGVVSYRSHESSTTHFVRLSMLGSSNALPVSLTEYRADAAASDRALGGQLRELYDHAVDSRGRADQTMAQYQLLAPLIIDGEDPLIEAALMERTIQVRLIPETIEADQPAARVWHELRELPLHQLAKPYIQYCLRTEPQYTKAAEMLRKQMATIPIKSERVLNNFTIVAMGLWHYGEWLHSLGVDILLPWRKQLYELLQDSLFHVISRSGRTSLLVDEFTEDVINETCVKGTPDFVVCYDPKFKTLGVHLPTAYAWWLQMRRRQNRMALDKRAIRAQLEERLLDTSAPMVGQYVNDLDHAVKVDGHVWRLAMFSLPAMREAGLDVPEEITNAKFIPAFSPETSAE